MASTGQERAAFIAAELKRLEVGVQDTLTVTESKVEAHLTDSVTESRLSHVRMLKMCLELTDNQTRLAAHLKDNMMPSTLRAIVLIADSMIPRESEISDEALIALVNSVRGLPAQALRELFNLPAIIPDAALDTSLPDLPVRVHKMMVWAGSVEHGRVHGVLKDIPSPDDDWREFLSCQHATDVLSPAVLEYFYPGLSSFQIQFSPEEPGSQGSVAHCQSCASESIGYSAPSTCSILTDSGGGDENTPDHHHVQKGASEDVGGPFQAVSCHTGALSERQFSPLSSRQSSPYSPYACSPDTVPCWSRLQHETGGSTSQGKPVPGGSCGSTFNPGADGTLGDGCLQHAGSCCPNPGPDLSYSTGGTAVVTRMHAELQDKGSVGGDSNQGQNDFAPFASDSDLGQTDAQAVAVKAVSGQTRIDPFTLHTTDIVASGSSRTNEWHSADHLFPETNFEDSEEDDGGCMEMFKSCMNDHSVYVTKRSRILQLSNQEVATASDKAVVELAQVSSSDMTSKNPGVCGNRTMSSRQECASSTAVTDAHGDKIPAMASGQDNMTRAADVDNACRNHGTGDCSKGCTTIHGGKDCENVKAPAAGEMAARLKAKLRTRAGGSSHVAAARGKQARAQRQKAARASERDAIGCTAMKVAPVPVTVAPELESVHVACKYCSFEGTVEATEPGNPASTSTEAAAEHHRTSDGTCWNQSQHVPPSVCTSVPMPDKACAGTTADGGSNLPTSNAGPPTANIDSSSVFPSTCATTSDASLPSATSHIPETGPSTNIEGAPEAALAVHRPANAEARQSSMSDLTGSKIFNMGTPEPQFCSVNSEPGQMPRPVSAPAGGVPFRSEYIRGADGVPLTCDPLPVDDLAVFPTAESFTCAAGSILTSVVANYVITAIPELMYTVCGQLTYDQVAQLLPTLACSSGLVAVLSGEPAHGSADSDKASELLEVCQKRYPTMKLPSDLTEAVEHDTFHARCRVVLRHVIKVSDRGEQCRKEDEVAAKQSSRGKKKAAKKMKPRRLVEELDVQAIMLELFQELLPPDCRLPMTMDHIHQLPMVKELLGSLPPSHRTDPGSEAYFPATERELAEAATAASEHPPAPTNAATPAPDTSAPLSADSQRQEQAERSTTKDAITQPPPVSKAASNTTPCGLRKLPPRSKRGAAAESKANLPITTSTNIKHRHQMQSASNSCDSIDAQVGTARRLVQPHETVGLTRMCCNHIDELINTWPTKVWCPVPVASQLQTLQEAVAAAADHNSTHPMAPTSLSLAAQKAATKVGLSDEALIYTLCTFAAPECQQACHELMWHHDARFRACAMRLPPPNFAQACASPKAVNSWVLPQAFQVNGCGLEASAGHQAADSGATSTGAAFMEPPPPCSTIEHPKMQAWADRVAADIVARRTAECESVKVALSQIVKHLGLDSFLDVSMKTRPCDQFKKGNMEVAMLHHRYSTEGGSAPPQRSWCMTLRALDSLQVNYQPRPSDAQLRYPCIPFECSGVHEAVKEHLGRCTLQSVADDATASTGCPAGNLLALSAAAVAPGRCGNSTSTFLDQSTLQSSTAELKHSADANKSQAGEGIQHPTVTPDEISKVWGEVSKSVSSAETNSTENPLGESKEQPSAADVLASVDAASSAGHSIETVCVHSNALEGSVEMDTDTLTGAAGLHKQCRMM